MKRQEKNRRTVFEAVRRFSLSINRFFRLLAAVSRISVFLLTRAAEKLLVSENRLQAIFKSAWVVLAGVERSPKIHWIFGERHFRQERGDFVDTLNRRTVFEAVRHFFKSINKLILRIPHLF